MVPALIAMHSFTPALNGVRRPWHVGVCWEHDPRLPKLLLAALREEPDIVVGDNEPYAIVGPTDYTTPEHGAKRGHGSQRRGGACARPRPCLRRSRPSRRG